MKSGIRGRTGVVGAAVVLALWGADSVHAAEFGYAARLGAAYSDNVELVPVDEVDSSAGVAGLTLTGGKSTGRLQYDVLGDIEYWDYVEEDVESQEYGRLSANSSYAFVPERFEWLLSGAFDQGRSDPLRPAAADNLENVLTGSTGPRVRVRLGDAAEALAEAHYAMADYSERTFDSETTGGLLTVGRRFAERSYLGLGASYDEVTYEDIGQAAGDFERLEYFLRLNANGTRTQVDADVGYAEITTNDLEESGPMVRLTLTRRMTPYVSGYVRATREYPTSAGVASSGSVTPGSLGDATVLSGAARENESAEVGFNVARPRTAMQLGYIWRQESTVFTTVQERTAQEVRGSISRQFATRSTGTLFGAYLSEDVEVADGNADETTYGLELSFSLGRSLSLDLRAQQRDRDADRPENNYSELSGGIFLRYGNARRFAAPAGGAL